MELTITTFTIFGVLVSRCVVYGIFSELLFPFEGNQEVYFEVYTPQAQDSPLVLNINNASAIKMYDMFDPSLEMRVLVHGYYRISSRAKRIRDKLFKCGKMNIVDVIWTQGSDTILPFIAQFNAGTTAKALAKFLTILEEQLGLSMNKVGMIGEGVGAGVAGKAGNILGNVSTILGLDPSLNIFGTSLHYDDAEYVQVIHSNFLLGTYSRSGGADIYVNSQFKSQPGCSTFDAKCSHYYSVKLYYKTLCNSRYTACREDHNGDCGYVVGGEPLHVYSGSFDLTTSE